MQSVILKRFGIQQLLRNNLHLRHVNCTRCFASNSSKQPKEDETLNGLSDVKRTHFKLRKKTKKHGPDIDFMQLWSTSEGYIQTMYKEAKTGTKKPMRNTFWTQNVSTLPLASELTEEEREELLEDDWSVDFRIPEAGDFASLTPVYKSLTEEEGEQILERKGNELEREEDKYAKKESDVVDTSKIVSFQDFDLHPKLVEKLNRDGITMPTAIQKQAIPLIFKRKSLLIQSETGSGKTLVFLLPALQFPGKAFGTVIIVPTRELASQLLFETRRLLGDKTIVESFVSGIDLSKQEARLKDNKRKPLIVIGTAKKILEIVDKDPSLVQHTKTIVIDEVDKVLLPLHRKTPFKKLTHRENHPRPAKLLVEKILKTSKVKPIQLIGASATVNDELKEDLIELGWGDHVTVIQSPSLEGKHRNVPPCIKHQYVICDHSLGITKAEALARIFMDSGQKSALVFIHRLQSVDSFVWELKELGINAIALYKQVANQDHEEYKKFLTDFRTGKINVVVGTEETVRGLDFKELSHVYLTEVAKNIDEYLHLAGRVGRQGRPGTATTLVSTKDPREEIRMKLEYRRLQLPFEQIIL